MKRGLIFSGADEIALQASLNAALGYPDNGTHTSAYTGALDVGSGNVPLLIDDEGWSYFTPTQQAAATDISDAAVQAVLSPARSL